METSITALAAEIKAKLKEVANSDDAVFLQRYFKTAPGEYGHGDIFIGVRVPETRKLLRGYKNLAIEDIMPLLFSPIHEERLFALLALVRNFDNGDESLQKEIFQLYLANTAHINNWDLVDSSAHHIVGRYLLDKNRDLLYELATSPYLWNRRIAVISTFCFIRKDQFDDTFAIAKLLLGDKEDLMHKAVGWMLREAGKRNQGLEEAFLQQHRRYMPRTMLRYAIEKFTPELRKWYLGR